MIVIDWPRQSGGRACTDDRSARGSARLEGPGVAGRSNRHVRQPDGQDGRDEFEGEGVCVATVRTRERGERCAFEAQLHVLHRRARGIGARPEVL